MWREENHSLFKKFIFKDFQQAFAFMTEIAAVAEELDHHPWWSNMYNQVEIKLTTHSAGNTVTAKDHALAQLIDELANRFRQG
ncbi:4a-hydroxytetrahydrobiopterin dehydratase [Rufibacter roseus]|uniref:4a-hydroxytetrahydrobiopterin dehydratase n=1 Tax=Rufibacter roseus TaxID=1567108 RepID=A0ABW2DHG4_9BACT|nr:4a-hydroxytetrahydrobiopterin dehydratase [Rufibacter roseus]